MAYFNAKESEDYFYAIDATVNIITEEEVVDVLRISCFFKHMN